MSQRKVERMKKNQRGFTIVELLIAVAILAIVVASVCGFILVGSRSYASANSDISVQQEAQLALNQMSDVLIDTTRSVNYAGYKTLNSGEKPVLALKDSEFGFEPVAKCLIMYNGAPVVTTVTNPDGTTTTNTTIEEGNGNKHYQFYWDKNDETLYYTELGVESDDVADPNDAVNPMHNISFPDFGDPGWVVLAEHVTKFEVDLTQVEEKRVVQLNLTFVNGKREYTTSNNVTIRNKVAVNDVEIGPLDRSKTISIVPRELSVILEPGETYHFSTPKVTGQNVTDKSVTWSIAPGYSGSSSFSDALNGILQIASDEPAGSFEVLVTTNATDSEGNQATIPSPITVYIKRVTKVTLTKTDDEDTENPADKVTPGKKFTVAALVEDFSQVGVRCSGCAEDVSTDRDVIDWTVEGPATMTDSSVKDGQFLVDDTAKEGDIIKIRATSYLSHRKVYPDVIGELILTVGKKKQSDLVLDGDIKWGRAVKIGVNYPGFNVAGQGYYIVCARINESLGAPANTDKIMLYGTNGHEAWLTPDLFGLDVQKTYYVSLQVIDPQRQFSSEDVQDVVDDYIANSGSGVYEGRFPHTSRMTCTIYPPSIYYNYKGEIVNGELNLDSMCATKGYQQTYFAVDHVANTIGEKNTGEVSEYVKFKVYRGKGKDSSAWGDPIYSYEHQDYYNKGGGSYQGNSTVGGLSFNEIQGLKNTITLQNNNVMDAVGEYHLVPWIKYMNLRDADHSYNDVYWKNYTPDYESEDGSYKPKVQFYKAPEYTVHLEVTAFNIEKLNAYYDNRQFVGQGYFPTPSENGFLSYFEREKEDLQTVWDRSIKLFCDFRGGNGEVCDVSFKRITCQYVSKENNAYILEFIYWDGKLNREVSAGRFRCNANGTKWEFIGF